MTKKYTGKNLFKCSEEYFFSNCYVIFEIDFDNETLYEVIEQMAIFHVLEFNEDTFIECLQECLRIISNLAYSYLTSEMCGYGRWESIEKYITRTEGFPDVDGSSGINLKVVEFSACLDADDFDIEEVTNYQKGVNYVGSCY